MRYLLLLIVVVALTVGCAETPKRAPEAEPEIAPPPQQPAPTPPAAAQKEAEDVTETVLDESRQTTEEAAQDVQETVEEKQTAAEETADVQPIPKIQPKTQPVAPKKTEPKVAATTTEPKKEKLVEVEKKPAPKPVLIIDNFESGNKWTVQKWEGARTGTLKVVTEGEGKGIELTSGEGKDKVAIGKSVKLDLDPYKSLKMELKNTGEKEVGFALAMSTLAQPGKAAVYYESPAVKVKPGEQQAIVFHLKKPYYKTAPNWTSFTAAVKGREKVQQLYLLVYGPEGSQVRISNIRATIAE